MNTEKIRLQTDLAAQVIVPNQKELSYQPTTNDYIFSFDIQYENNYGYVAIDIVQFPNIKVGTFTHKASVTHEYQPGFFSFREGPLLLEALEAFKTIVTDIVFPNLLIIDGHGIAHPRKFGVASYLGVKTGLPTIGVGKRTLLKYDGELAEARGSTLPIYLDDEIVGNVLRTQDNTNPVFVSNGHKVHLDIACDIALHFAANYKNLDTIRRADMAARAFAKGEMEEGFFKYKV
ncbi:MAG: endonuclease V [Saprospiraceae bacterium]